MHQPPPQLLMVTRHQPIIFWTRRHLAAFAPRLIMIGLAAIATIPLIPLAVLYLSVLQLALVLTLYYLVIGMIAATEWLTFWDDYFVITRTSIFQINRQAIFKQRITELPLNDIIDVHTEYHGLWEHLFGYGRLRIETAGSTENPVIVDLPNPQTIASQLIRNKNQPKERTTNAPLPNPDH